MLRAWSGRIELDLLLLSGEVGPDPEEDSVVVEMVETVGVLGEDTRVSRGGGQARGVHAVPVAVLTI